jgi:hypothetical protein
MAPRLVPLKAVITNVTTGADVDQIASNIYFRNWPGTLATDWGIARSVAPFSFTPNAYSMIGELCEVNGVATVYTGTTTNDATREARIRSFANLVTPRSQSFTVYAVGQSVKEVCLDPLCLTKRTNVLAEAKAQAVVQRLQNPDKSVTPWVYGNTNNTVAYKILYFRYLE